MKADQLIRILQNLCKGSEEIPDVVVYSSFNTFPLSEKIDLIRNDDTHKTEIVMKVQENE